MFWSAIEFSSWSLIEVTISSGARMLRFDVTKHLLPPEMKGGQSKDSIVQFKLNPQDSLMIRMKKQQTTSLENLNQKSH